MKYQKEPYISFLLSILLTSVILLLLPLSCEKFEPQRKIKVKTEAITDIQHHSSKAEGIIIDIGEKGISEHGHCWSTTPNPTIDGPRTQLGNTENTGSYISQLEELIPSTTYYVRAYAQFNDLVFYGEDLDFYTPDPILPSLSTHEVTEIRMNSAICGGDILDDGGNPVSMRGVCWNTTGNPTPEDPHTENGEGAGTFSSELTSLDEKTTYHVRAYAITGTGIGYGNDRVFTTTSLPVVNTLEITAITPNSATCIGVVEDDGGTEIIVRGFCWGTEEFPTVDGPHSELTGGTGEFSGDLNELQSAQSFHVRAYAVNNNGIDYGDDLGLCTSFMDSRDGKIYSVVQIGEQYWMTQNLDVGNQVSIETGQSDNDEIEKYCYDDSEANCEEYGGLYTWSEMMQYTAVEMTQGVCPSGWHIASDQEWKVLEMTLGMGPMSADSVGWRGTDEGGALKYEGEGYWEGPNVGATNMTGFSALPAGVSYEPAKIFDGLHIFTTYWTSSQTTGTEAWYRQLENFTGKTGRFEGQKPHGTPVRCLKD